jgi:hypothetical protein
MSLRRRGLLARDFFQAEDEDMYMQPIAHRLSSSLAFAYRPFQQREMLDPRLTHVSWPLNPPRLQRSPALKPQAHAV